MKVIAFYLPQFHPIPENDAWWGKGFTEWTNVAPARPQFPGHYQPHVPADLGYYDLRDSAVRERQVELAARYGIYGFCYHYYYFGGRKLLERPLQEVLSSGRPDFPFCVCWANENWTRRWDGLESEVLMAQVGGAEADINFIRELLPLFRDPRYIKVGGKPLLVIYRTDIMESPRETAARWRTEVSQSGFPGLYLVRAETFTAYGAYTSPESIGFDAAVEFPPHAVHSRAMVDRYAAQSPAFKGEILDYAQIVGAAIQRQQPDYKLFRGVFPQWDNTARRGANAKVIVNSSPRWFEVWLKFAMAWTAQTHGRDEQFVFINAWNEWAEGCHLEPDVAYGRQYLEAAASALKTYDGLAGDVRANALREAQSLEATSDVSAAVPASVLLANRLAARLRHGPARVLYHLLRPFWRLWKKLTGV